MIIYSLNYRSIEKLNFQENLHNDDMIKRNERKRKQTILTATTSEVSISEAAKSNKIKIMSICMGIIDIK